MPNVVSLHWPGNQALGNRARRSGTAHQGLVADAKFGH
jgi:hypothetical protein